MLVAERPLEVSITLRKLTFYHFVVWRSDTGLKTLPKRFGSTISTGSSENRAFASGNRFCNELRQQKVGGSNPSQSTVFAEVKVSDPNDGLTQSLDHVGSNPTLSATSCRCSYKPSPFGV